MKPEKLFNLKKIDPTKSQTCKEAASELLQIAQNNILQKYEFAFVEKFTKTGQPTMESIVMRFGASTSNSVTSKTRVLVLGEERWLKYTSKENTSRYPIGGDIDRAIQLNMEQDVKIYGEEEFYEAMKQCAETYCPDYISIVQE